VSQAYLEFPTVQRHTSLFGWLRSLWRAAVDVVVSGWEM
jgi:hypothetical protein